MSDFFLEKHSEIYVQQRHEMGELFGLETRNKYEILDSRGGHIGFCAEQQKGFLGLIMRQYFGHWRRFDLHFFGNDRQVMMTAHHPFRWLFQRLEIRALGGAYLGAIQQRFGVLTKKFDIEDEHGRAILSMRSGFFSIWTFPVSRMGQEVAKITKKWSGVLREAFTDADNFRIEFRPQLNAKERQLLLAAAVFIDLQYFEKKAGSR